jgi:hypothetical protein
MGRIRSRAFAGVASLAVGLSPAIARAGETTVNPAEAQKDFVAPATTWSSANPPSTAQTRDEPLTRAQMAIVTPHAMPPLALGEYGTTVDNENNANTHRPDGDMDAYIYNSSPNAPIEYNIQLPVGAARVAGTLRMDVFDIDAVWGEVDIVYVNGVKVGVLNGSNNAWGVNIFSIPPGVLRDGRNLVRILVDTANPGRGFWALTVDWGIIALPPSAITADITRCWVAPARQRQGDYVNFFAETNKPVDTVKVTVAGSTFALTDPDRDNVWSGQWRIPTTVAKADYALRFGATQAGRVISTCPTLRVR